MIYGYARCSTNKERQDVTRQTAELMRAGAETIFAEYEHGDKEHKQKQEELFNTVQQGDTIIITEVSRLSRSTQQLCKLIDTIKEKRLCLVILNSVTIDCRNGELDPMTAAFLQMAGVFAQLELNMTRARTKSSVDHRRELGLPIGRPKTTADDIPDIFYKHYPKYKSGELNATEFARVCNIGRTSLYKYLKIVEGK